MRLEISGTRTPTLPSPSQGESWGGGEVLLAEQGVYLPEGRPVWQIGELRLTGERLLFLQPRGVIFNTPLTLIAEVAAESKRFTVVKKIAMAISYRDPRRGSVAKAWFITPSLGQWLNHLAQMISTQNLSSLHPVSPSPPRPLTSAPPPLSTSAQDLERLAVKLDPGSREILWYLWLNRHATINELAELIAAPTHMDVLFRIRQGINPVAEEVLGRPILIFEESKFDQETGDRVPFSWWLAGRAALATEGRKPEIEVFNEAHEINVIVELPGVEEEAVRVSAQREKVVLWIEGAKAHYHEEVSLSAPVDADRVVTRFKNGILIVNLKRISDGEGDK